VLRRANVSWADLSRASLRHADLRETNLRGANLQGANLYWAHLQGADLSQANLIRANLRESRLVETDLVVAKLGEADLSEANLSRANLERADLYRANLQGAKLRGTDLSGADLSWADLSQAMVGWTTFGDIDLSTVRGLDTVIHDGPSIIGIDTIYRSKGNIPEVFLRGAGVPEDFIIFMHSLAGKPIPFFSCFISYSSKDKGFCDRLYSDLQANGVRAWYFPEDAKWGETVWGEIERGIQTYDKLVVVCSKNSLQSGPVLREIERGLKREDEEGKNIVFPITIDGYIFDGWEHERKTDVLRLVVGDFRGWKRSATKYEAAFKKLLETLKAEGAKA